MKTKTNTTKKLAEASVMIAFAAVLSLLKLVDMPYGGSVTAASMLPIIIVSYRHGIGTGIASGLVFATIQQLLGLNTLSYVTGWKSILAVITLDYIFAFTLIGLAGVFKNVLGKRVKSKSKRQGIELIMGTVLACILRYVCHTVAGATVWAGLSIPTEAAIVYSVGYNATYMLPEMIVTAIAAGFVGSVIDLSQKIPARFAPKFKEKCERMNAPRPLFAAIAFLALFAVLFNTVLIAPYLQNENTGEFDFSGLKNAPWSLILSVAAACICIIAVLAVFIFVARKRSKNTDFPEA